MEQTVYILLGPKGSGKSFIGSLIDQNFDIKFIRVENWAKQIVNNRSIEDDNYLRNVFTTIEHGIRNELSHNDKVVFESTGLTPYFNGMLTNLKNDFLVKTIEVKADEELCLHRVKNRDQSIHINVSDEQVKRINQRVQEKMIPCDFTIENNDKSEDGILLQLKMFLN
ncbi:MAG: hypothetical protein CL840_11485 [Crocinitomicaceae bacterium]|nr:hypothetical protein [Crocinitomicaceae bacterium]|tara:strand:- start:8239 stop:8742 length:504 start_codon:yes stop_codon:yes gene_type:complete